MKGKKTVSFLFALTSVVTLAGPPLVCNTVSSTQNAFNQLVISDLSANINAINSQKMTFQLNNLPYQNGMFPNVSGDASIAIGLRESQSLLATQPKNYAIAVNALKGGVQGSIVSVENLYNLDNVLRTIQQNSGLKNFIIIVPETLYNQPELKAQLIKISQNTQTNVICTTLTLLSKTQDANENGECVVVLPTDTLGDSQAVALSDFIKMQKDSLVVYSTQTELTPMASGVVDSAPIAQAVANTIMMNLKNHFIYNLGITVTDVPFFDAVVTTSPTLGNGVAFSGANNFSGSSVTLASLLSYMLENNPAIQSSNSEVESTHYQLNAVNGGYLPQLSANVQGLTTNPNQAEYSSGQARQFSTTGNLQLSQVIYNGDLNFASKQAAVSYTIDTLNRDQTVNSIYTQTVESYLNLLQAQANEKLVSNSLDVTTTNLTLAKSAQAVGSGDLESVLRLESQQLSYKNQYLNAQMAVKNARSSLTMLTGNSSISGASVGDVDYNDLTNSLQVAMPSQDAMSSLKEKLYAYALSHNLQLQLLKSQIQIAKYNQENQDNQFILPTITAFGQVNQVISQSNPIYASSMSGFVPMFNEMTNGKSTTNWSMGIQVSYPLFTGFTTTNNAKSAKTKVESLQQQYDWGVAQVDNQIDTALNQLSMILFSKTNSAENVASSNKSLLLAQAQFQAGTSTITDFLSAQNSDFQAQVQDVNLKYSYFETLAQLKSVLNMSDISDADFAKQFNLN